MKHISIEAGRLANVLVFALLFVSLSWLIPAGYYAVAPPDQMLSVDRTDVATTPNGDGLALNASYHAKEDWPAKVSFTLYKVENGTVPVEIEQWEYREYLAAGRHTANVNLTPGTTLEPGMYFIKIDVDIQTRYYVERHFSFETDTFDVKREVGPNASVSNSNGHSPTGDAEQSTPRL